MVDRYWIATADRISPEAPIPVFKVYSTFSYPGGAGNVSNNLKALGVEVINVPEGTRQSLQPNKHRLIVNDQQVARWDTNDKCSPLDVGRLKAAKDADAIVVADYCKGTIDAEVVVAIAALNKPIFVDTKGDPSIWQGYADAVFPNEKEYQKFARVYDSFPTVVRKRGNLGMSLISPGGVANTPSLARYVRSVVGAGDTVVAAFAYKYLLTQDPLEAFWFANAAAAVVCEKPYTSVATVEEVEEVLRRT